MAWSEADHASGSPPFFYRDVTEVPKGTFCDIAVKEGGREDGHRWPRLEHLKRILASIAQTKGTNLRAGWEANSCLDQVCKLL